MTSPSLHAVCVGLGAFLLFTMQFVVAKALLPWFGGAPAVWTTSLVFFQVVLLLGYLWADRLSRAEKPRDEAGAHAIVLFAAAAIVVAGAMRWPSALTPSAELRPAAGPYVAVWMLLTLLTVAGAPAFALSATAPLLQRWFHRAHPGRSPYPLYALSNAGSLGGVLAYPTLVEPSLSVSSQGRLWTALFLLQAGLVALLARRHAGKAGTPAQEPAAPTGTSSPRTRASWFLLPAAGSLALVAVTNHLTLNVASVPFLWVPPLALYLVSFVLAFGRAEKSVLLASRALVATAVPLTAVIFARGGMTTLLPTVATYLAFVLAATMLAHAELARRKPEPARLTEFYLWIAAGGAFGSLVGAVAAPALLTDLWEVPMAILAAAALLLVSVARVAAPRLRSLPAHGAAAVLAVGALAALAVPLFGAVRPDRAVTLLVKRSFYGYFRVVRGLSPDGEIYRALVHGQIVHGVQLEAPIASRTPTTYYGRASGAELCLTGHPRARRDSPMRVGGVGLGAGTIATYGRKGDLYRFYELDPAVADLSLGRAPVFTFLSATEARVEVVVGDGRLALEGEPANGFDVLVLDAFSSESIPLHLLTREALSTYRGHLRDEDSVLAFHVTNLFVDLEPPLARLALEFGMSAFVVRSAGEGRFERTSTWVILAAPGGWLERERDTSPARPLADSGAPLWTDAYSNLFRSLRVASRADAPSSSLALPAP